MSVSRNLPLIVTLGLHLSILLSGPVMAGTNSILLKTGTREMTHTLTPSSSLIPADALTQFPSEKRAQPEQAMQVRSGQPRTHQSTECITSQHLDQNRIIRDTDDTDIAQCTNQVISQFPRKLSIERTCPAPDAYTSRIVVKAMTPESLIASIDMSRDEASKVFIDVKGR